MEKNLFFNRDISWLSFNGRVLMEAASASVPLMERLKFLSIFSSNLDEFYRVRIPAVMAMQKINAGKNNKEDLLKQISAIINDQQQLFGKLLNEEIIPQLKKTGLYIVYNEVIPGVIRKDVIDYFFHTIAAYLKIVFLKSSNKVFPENNKLYCIVTLERKGKSGIVFINVPSDHINRFYRVQGGSFTYLVFIDDIIKCCLPLIFSDYNVTGSYNIKITRDAQIDLVDEMEGDISEKIESQLNNRELGSATRFLYPPALPVKVLEQLVDDFNLSNVNLVIGGNYHNLRDLATLPITSQDMVYEKRSALHYSFRHDERSLLREILPGDILIHTPYYSYDTILRFFNEAAVDKTVDEIYTTLYRVASESRIVHALISAALNGKKVTVFVELKARFDEANNIKWGKRMKAAGIKVIYSIAGLKVHAKIALIKRKTREGPAYCGLLATGNLNETTARFYTDHILLTANTELLQELEMLFNYLGHPKKAEIKKIISFRHLLVSQFNLQTRFLELIDTEIANARKGLPAFITIKINNLEEKVMISKLYEASRAGVKITLIIRSICCLVPEVSGMSENITVTRIVDRYLEHGRIFVFHNNGNEIIYMGSSDWMNRNIYRRIEVCFPLYNEALKKEIKDILAIQLNDNVSAVQLTDTLESRYREKTGNPVRSQEAIHYYFCEKAKS